MLAEVLRKEPTVEICANSCPPKRVSNPFRRMSDGQIAEFLSGFETDYVTYAPHVELRTDEFVLNYMAHGLVVNFRNPKSGRWLQVARKRTEIDNFVLQTIPEANPDEVNLWQETPGGIPIGLPAFHPANSAQ